MNKIVIIGSPGAGKSTFAQILGELLHVEVIHLDRLFWQTGWKEFPRNVRIKIQQHYLDSRERWIMEGTYLSSSDDRLNAADTIIFLGLPRLLCLWRIIKRHFETSHQYRLDLPDGCTDKLSLRCIAKVLVFPHRGLKQFMRKIHQIRICEVNQPKQTTILLFRSPKDVNIFLHTIQKQKPFFSEEQDSVLEYFSEMQYPYVLPPRRPLSQRILEILPSSLPHTPLSINTR
jgi:adenylate kinase family enzyme